MTAVTVREETRPVTRTARRRRRWRGLGLRLYTLGVLAWLMLPIAIIILFGFNNVHGRFNYRWQGFTLRWYRHPFDIPDLTTALVNSLTIACIVTAISVVMGTLAGFALGRWRFLGSRAVELTLFAVIAASEIAMATGLLSLFISLGVPRGYWTIVISQVTFDVAYVAVTVQARMAAFDRSLEEAARDLGAGPLVTFARVTLPMLLPGIIAGALLAFALSIDDFVITQFNAGKTLTFPLWVYGATRLGIPPEVNVLGTMIFVGGVLLAAGGVVVQRIRR
ncbi:binding-protein-dependent transport systems inner membrane component [Acidothermus cellulolyticus 11B]|uniref:Binding-protein-dependent transport systems inner membrane component n=1 Tax=Acidothermus cellulolyticus (strain ATCC 43068 / DSM 8971 / 11B) TaxID=351607 RepID=A0LUE3_ACIC1|nr:ABC transporter permease [Acidothermus cellulolyticus]ABK53053.1 binding-protein-dependent transport systems inner membrane component [Acidothermus cellulolyticus 11B]MBX5448162.1 ABC transporter permease [Acidothermus cellulolyticus]